MYQAARPDVFFLAGESELAQALLRPRLSPSATSPHFLLIVERLVPLPGGETGLWDPSDSRKSAPVEFSAWVFVRLESPWEGPFSALK